MRESPFIIAPNSKELKLSIQYQPCHNNYRETCTVTVLDVVWYDPALRHHAARETHLGMSQHTPLSSQ